MKQEKLKKHKVVIVDRDYQLLRFLWKWKAVSTAAISRKFFPGIQVHSAYRRLQYLEAGGYIQALEVGGRWREVWGLTDKSYRYIRPKLGELCQEGYKSENRYHDYLATALHLGDWLTEQPEDTQTFSEQQLRRFHEELWPAWIPTSNLHRPDGYSLFFQNENPTVIAFEVELFAKTIGRYESVVAFYDAQAAISLVIWLVDGRTAIGGIKNGFNKFMIRDCSKHQFVVLSDFKSHGWAAPIIEGRFQGRSIADCLNPIGVHTSSTGHPRYDALALLDSARRPINSKTCKTIQN